MKALKIIGLAIIGLIVIVLVWGLTLPDTTVLERSAVINAKPQVIYAELNNFKNFNEWSPWFQIDPNTKYKFEGPEKGLGAKMSWQSEHPDVGNGSQWIVKVEKNKMVKNQMTFDGMGDAKMYAYFNLEPQGDATKITWGYKGSEMGLIGNMFSALLLKGTLGKNYEEGLAALKTYIESKPAPTYNVDLSIEDTKPMTYLGIIATSKMESAAIGEKVTELLEKLLGYMQNAKIESSGHPFAIYHDVNLGEGKIECGMPVVAGTEVNDEEIKFAELPSAKAVKAIHKGDYANLRSTYEEIEKYMSDNSLSPGGNPWEVYITNPGQVADTAQWITHVYFPIN